MPITLASVLPDFAASLNDARKLFGEDGDQKQTENLTRLLQIAARALGLGKRPRTCQGSLALVAGQSSYATVPEDLLLPKVGLWGIDTSAPWLRPSGALPILTLSELGGVNQLLLSPAPNAAQINAFGSEYRYYYFGAHTITDAGSTLQERDRSLLILRAQIEALREIAIRNSGKPVTMREGSAGGVTRNATPAALYERMLAEYNEAA